MRYPSRVQLIAAMNPCRCGNLSLPGRACSRAPKCALDYQAKISGPLLDRIDLLVETPAIPAAELNRLPPGEPTAPVAARVAAARKLQTARFAALGLPIRLNAEAEGEALDRICEMDEDARDLLGRAAEKLGLSARGMSRALRIARTVADLEECERVLRRHIAEAVGFRRAIVAH